MRRLSERPFGAVRILAGERLSDIAAELRSNFCTVERIQGDYPTVVNELIPALLQAGFSQLSGFAQSKDAPPLADDDDLQRAIASVRARRAELLALAGNEAAVATAKWYALARIKLNTEETLESLAQWDRSPTSVAEDLVACAGPRIPRQ